MAPVACVFGLAAVLPAAAGAQTAATPNAGATPTASAPATSVEPRVPGTTNAASPFRADRTSSEPLGLSPNQVGQPFIYPNQPIVLQWSPVPGAVAYTVEISSTPGFTAVQWRRTTDQESVAPEVLLPDGQYWWRVTAFDKAGTKGIVSQAARFAKRWPSQVSGGVVSDHPFGAPTSLIRMTPHMRWNHLPGGAYYETQVSAADQFATPIFRSQNFPLTQMNTGTGLLPDDSYAWRVRALDANKNPGEWTTMGSFTKQWTGVNVLGPADGAQSADFNLHWEPLPGAEKYHVQITRQANVWQGTPLQVNAETGNAALTPSTEEMMGKGMVPGVYWWRVRPVTAGTYGAWSAPRRVEWVQGTGGTGQPTLHAAPDSTTALSPTMRWSPVASATLYRVDVATDPQFTNIIESEHTRSSSWTPRTPLPDNQVRDGYYWRVLWGTGVPDNAQFFEDESRVAHGEYRKQAQVTLGDSASGVVTEPPVFTWNDVTGAARYELQLSTDAEFDAQRTQSDTVYGLGTAWLKDQSKRLPSGQWFWRVRALDAGGVGQTWSVPKSFTLNPPRVNVTAPNDGATVIGSPLITWEPQIAACAYQVQFADNPGFQNAETGPAPAVERGGGEAAPGMTPVEDVGGEGALGTPQTAFVPTGAVITKTGRWYYRVRTQFCGANDFSAWSPARSFISTRPPSFNLNKVPNVVPHGTRQRVAGRLVHDGRGVANRALILERRLWPARDYRRTRVVRTDRTGRFNLVIPVTRTASYRLRWAQTASNPQAVAPFVIRARARVSFNVNQRRMVRNGALRVRGTVFPRRVAFIQVRESNGWRNVRRLPAKRARFNVVIRRPGMQVGRQRLRLFVPQDRARTLEPTPSAVRNVLVFDRFVMKVR